MKGPFGDCQRKSSGDVLNAMCRIEKIPLGVVTTVQVGDGQIHYSGNIVGRFQYFDGIEQPLFSWGGEFAIYRRQHIEIDEKGKKYPKFRLSMTVHEMPGFEIEGKDATPALHHFMRYPMLTNITTHECYELKNEAGAFFQGGSHDEKGQWILIEFWKPAGAQAWLDYLNQHFDYDKQEE